MPALQTRQGRARLAAAGLRFASVSLPKQQRETRIVKDMPAEEIAREIVAWIAGGITMETILLLAHTEADGTLAKPALEALAAALALGGELDRRPGGRRRRRPPPTRSPAAARRAFWRVTGEAFAQPRYATDAAAAEALCRAAGRRHRAGAAPPRAGRARCPAWRTAWAAASTRTPPALAVRDGAPAVDPLVLPPAHGRRC